MHIIKVCTGCACSKNFGNDNLKRAEKILGIKAGETTPDGLVKLESSGCLGQCSLGPNVYFGESTPLSEIMNTGHVETRCLPPKLAKKIKAIYNGNQ